MVAKRLHKNIRMTSVLIKMAVIVGYLKVKMDLSVRWHPKVCARKRIQHEFVDRIDKSVPQVTTWHHLAEPRNAKQVTFGTELSILSTNS